MAKGKKAVSFTEVSEAFRTARNILGLEAELKPVSGDDTSCVLICGDSCQTYKNSNLKGHIQFMLEASKVQTILPQASGDAE